MNLKTHFFDEDRGVSPVIGVILMVAITVILAAVIATFVMNMGPQEEQPPTASWDVTDESSHILVDHTGGGGADASKLSVAVTYDSTPGGEENFELVSDLGYAQDTTLNASSSFHLYNHTDSYATGNSPPSGTGIAQLGSKSSTGTMANYITANVESIELIWEAENSDNSDVLTSWEA